MIMDVGLTDWGQTALAVIGQLCWDEQTAN
jgi:hypothetical protein